MPHIKLRVLGLLVIALLFTGCPKNDNKPNAGSIGVSSRAPIESRGQAPIPGAIAFNGERAMDHVRKQIEIGPRPPGSAELAKTREYIIGELKKSGFPVTTDSFTVSTPAGEKKMVNIVAELAGESPEVVILASHYDTKLYKDMYFVGANDPAASVGTLLELGRVLAGTNPKPKLTYRLIFFDGEEAFCEDWDQCGKPGEPDNTYGSRRYVAELERKGEKDHVKALILLDMMGYKNLELGRDTMSTKWLQDVIWDTGRELGHKEIFVDRAEGVGGDDHEPFLRAGIDSVDMIQLLGYPYWHKATDTIDKVSAKSMKIVGDVVLASLPKIEHRIADKPTLR